MVVFEDGGLSTVGLMALERGDSIKEHQRWQWFSGVEWCTIPLTMKMYTWGINHLDCILHI